MTLDRRTFLAGGGGFLSPAPLDLHAMLRPVPEVARFVDPAYYIWCGTVVRGYDKLYHLLYSRWPRELKHAAWVTHSEVAHAVSREILGPYRHVNVALPVRGAEHWDGLSTHNPTVHRFGKRFYLYYTGNIGDGKPMAGLNWTHRNNQRIGVAVANTPGGPWARFDKPVIDVSANPDAPDSLMVSNPSVTQRPDGRYLMVYKAVGRKRPLPFGGPVVHLTAIADNPAGPFQKQLRPIFTAPGQDFPAEDPYVWYDGGRYRYFAIVKDMQGAFTKAGKSLALFESADGFDWKPADRVLVSETEIKWASGRVQRVNSLERPQLFFEGGVPVALFCAVDEEKSRPHSYNLHIPLKHP